MNYWVAIFIQRSLEVGISGPPICLQPTPRKSGMASRDVSIATSSLQVLIFTDDYDGRDWIPRVWILFQ